MSDTTEQEELREQAQPTLLPNIQQIADIIAVEGALHHGETKAQRAASDNAKQYTRIEKELNGNKDAAKAVRKLIKMGLQASDDFMRTFEPLCDHFRLWPKKDLASEGSPRAVERAPTTATAGQAELLETQVNPSPAPERTVEDSGIEPDEVDPPSNVTPFQSALDRGRAHLASGTKEPAAVPAVRKPRAKKEAPDGAVVH